MVGELKRELARMREKVSGKSVKWRLKDGTEVQFTNKQMLEGLFNMLRRSYAAEVGEPLPERDPVSEAILRTDEATIQRLAEGRRPWYTYLHSEERIQGGELVRDELHLTGKEVSEKDPT